MMKRLLMTISAAIALSAAAASAGPVEQYGRLMADGNKIVGEKSGGEAVQLKGPSFPWSVAQWGTSRFFTAEAVDAMVDGWKAEVIRFPLGISYVAPGYNVTEGYDIPAHRASNWERVKLATDHAISRGVYAVVDWHTYYTHSPERTELAIDFFTNDDLAGQYGNNPAVIFEIYNEPLHHIVEDGDTTAVTWQMVKEYSEAVIGAIRAKGFNNLVIVGNPSWSSTPDSAAANPPVDSNGEPFENMAMSFHFYSQTHRLNAVRYLWSPGNTWNPTGTYRNAILNTLDKGFPVFVSEWGATHSGSEFLYDFPAADVWHNFLDSLKISSCAWTVAVSGSVQDFWTNSGNPLTTSNWTDPYGMTPHGKYVYHWLTKGDTATPPRRQVYEGERRPIELSFAALNPYANDSSDMAITVDDGTMHAVFSIKQGGTWAGAGVHHSIDWLAEHCEFGLGYTYKGSPHSMRIEQSNVTNWAIHMSEYTTQTDEWREVVIPWGSFHQPGWNTVPIEVNPDSVEAISWYLDGAPGTSGEFWIKDVYCLCDADGGKWVSVRNHDRRPAAAASQFVKVSGKTLQLRLLNDSKINIYAMNGKRVRTIDVKRGDHVIRMNNLPKGMYVVNVNSKSSAWKQSARMLIK